MRLTTRFLLLTALLLLTFNLVAQDTDADGCKDSAIITRMPGSIIHNCDNKEFDQAKMPIDKDGNEKAAEVKFHYWDYGTREGVSEIQVFRNFETALKQAGFTVVYEDSPGIITAHKGGTWYMLDNKGTFYYQTIVTEKSMNQEVTADAFRRIEKIRTRRGLRHSLRNGEGRDPAGFGSRAGRNRENAAAESGRQTECGRPYRQRGRRCRESDAVRETCAGSRLLADGARSCGQSPDSQGLGTI